MAELLPPQTRLWVLGSGKVGHEVNCLGVAAALGVTPVIQPISPRTPFVWMSPWGPVDPADRPQKPFPDIVLASGRATVPYLRYLKQRSNGRVFTVFLQDPRGWRSACDMIWIPEHDSHRGPNVLTTLTSPHPLTPQRLAAERAAPPAAIAALPRPRVALVLGGPSSAHRFEEKDLAALTAIAVDVARAGKGVMVTASRRTPAGLAERIRAALLAAGLAPERFLVWDGAGENPYAAMVANADAIVVTGDSVNMVGEAAATGAPVHVYEPSGGSAKITSFIDGLVARGAVRRWSGQLEDWTYEPVDATHDIARELARRYLARRKDGA